MLRTVPRVPGLLKVLFQGIIFYKYDQNAFFSTLGLEGTTRIDDTYSFMVVFPPLFFLIAWPSIFQSANLGTASFPNMYSTLSTVEYDRQDA